ncbi:MAG: thioredoxin domain-containing protein [Hyphomicrobiales bacterium]|nr:thioredoxin domain-containing protein [Hyphomicrobiales bacterium]
MEAALNLVKQLIAAIAVAVMFAAAPAWATHPSQATSNFSAEQRREIEDIVRAYLLDHPEVIAEAIQKLELQQQQAEEQSRREAASSVKPVNSEDHIRGDVNASVKIVEFSDFECPFCKQFHKTMQQLMDKYGKSGKVAWIYRHFPIDELHPKARKEAQAAECAFELGGNSAFWAYADKVFDVTPSNNRLDLALLPQIAQDIGLDRAKFETCLEGDVRGGKYATHIESNVQDATASGGTGTPYSLVIGPKGEVTPINGAQIYRVVKEVIDTEIAKE